MRLADENGSESKKVDIHGSDLHGSDFYYVSQITVDTNPWFIRSLLFGVGTTTVSAAGTMEPNMLAYRLALLGAAAFLLIGLCFALKISDADAAATIRKNSGQGLFRRQKKSPSLTQES